MNTGVKAAIVLVSVAFAAVCGYLITTKNNQFDVYTIASYGSMEFDFFAWWNGDVCFGNVNVLVDKIPDLAANQKEILTSFDRIYTAAPYFGAAQWFTAFYAYVDAVGKTPAPDAGLNATMADQGWKLDSSWTHPVYAPLGTASSDEDIFLTQFTGWKQIPFDNPWMAFAPGGNVFQAADSAGANMHLYEDDTEPRRPTLINIAANQAGVCDTPTLAGFSASVEVAREQSPIADHMLVFGNYLSNWAIFDVLDDIMMRTILIDMGCVLVLSAICLQDVFASIVSLLGIAIIVVETFGLCAVLMSFNPWLAGAVIMSVGISVEFVAHTVAAFAGASGSSKARLTHALCDIGPALLQGTLTTFFGIIPMAFHRLPGSREYFFPAFSMVCVCGLYNAFVFVPAALACSNNKGADEAL